MRRWTACSLLVLFAVVGCSEDSPSTLSESIDTTITSQAATTISTLGEELVEQGPDDDVSLVKQLWRGFSDSWFGGNERGMQYLIDHNYPDFQCEFDEMFAARFPNGPVEGFEWEAIVQSDTIEPDEGWVIPGGGLEGMTAKGRVYIMSVTDTYREPGFEPLTEPREVHVTILEGKAWFFFGCPTDDGESGTTTTLATSSSGFGDGTWLIGTDIDPGVYEAPGTSLGCYWERLSGLSGEFDDVSANDLTSSKSIVEILPADVAFSSEDCGIWTQLLAYDLLFTEFGDGVWAVGRQIEAGRYRADGGEGCYWERLSGFSGDFDNLIANDLPSGSVIVDIKQGDVGFRSDDCGTWLKVTG